LAKIRVFVISVHLMFSRGIESLLCQETDIEFVGHALSVKGAIEEITMLQPDVIIMDSDSVGNEIEFILTIKPDVSIINLNLQNKLCFTLGLRVVAPSQRAAEQGSGAELLKQRFLWSVGAA
jgi:DNA-binding NarL/FixJ family response regulator